MTKAQHGLINMQPHWLLLFFLRWNCNFYSHAPPWSAVELMGLNAKTFIETESQHRSDSLRFGWRKKKYSGRRPIGVANVHLMKYRLRLKWTLLYSIRLKFIPFLSPRISVFRPFTMFTMTAKNFYVWYYRPFYWLECAMQWKYRMKEKWVCVCVSVVVGERKKEWEIVCKKKETIIHKFKWRWW